MNNEIINTPKKRGRKPKKVVDENVIQEKELVNDSVKPRKRGRKPKGGKIIVQTNTNENQNSNKTNVILHLKCSLKDLQSSNLVKTDIESYNFNNDNILSYNIMKKETKEVKIKSYEEEENCILDENNEIKMNDSKIIWNKLKQLQHKLHNNNCNDKKSACFWCTYDFDNPPVFIPKHFINESYHVYGCFCSPECGAAYLMNESMDSSIKFERYYLLNYIYAKIFNYEKNIKPAPNPHHTLEKYYGNLSIQEYRSLFKNERLFLIVDKPLTRILPELHEDNDDFIINNKIIPSNNFQVKKKLSKKIDKNNIVNETFGLS
jgi:hypothetical protein